MTLAAGGAAIWVALGAVVVAGLVVVVVTASRDRIGARRFKRWAATRVPGPAPAPLLDLSELLAVAEADLVVVHATVGTTEGPWHVAVAHWSAGTDDLVVRYTTVCVGLDAPAAPAAILPAPAPRAVFVPASREATAPLPAGTLGPSGASRRWIRTSGAFGLRSPLRWYGGTAAVPDTSALGIDVLAGDAAGVHALVDPLAAELARPAALTVGSTRFAVERVGASLVVLAPGVPRQLDALVTRAVELAALLGAPGHEVAVLA